jgi:predicted ATPase
MYALFAAARAPLECGNYAAGTALIDELGALADDKGTVFWKASGMVYRGCVLALTGQTLPAVHCIDSGIAALQSTGATLWLPNYLSCLGTAYAELGQFDDAWRCIREAETSLRATKSTLFEAEVNRIAGEIAIKSPDRDYAKAQIFPACALSRASAAS